MTAKSSFTHQSATELLTFAAAYLLDHAAMLERAHRDAYGRIRPEETRLEIRALRAFIVRAEQLVPGSSLSSLAPYGFVDAPRPVDPEAVLEIVEAEIKRRGYIGRQA